MSEEILVMKNICKQYPGVSSLVDANLSVKRGEVHALLGENGAGKSTLVNILSGMSKMDSGEIYMNGNKVDIRNPIQAEKLGIAVIHQETDIFPRMTVLENIFLGREVLIKNRLHLPYIDMKKVAEISKSILDKITLKVDIYEKVQNLNIVQKQFIQIARALLINPQIIIMDEISASLTDVEIEMVFKIIRELKEEGKSVIYISHRLNEIGRISDRVTILKDGRTVYTEYINQIKTESLIKMMLGKDLKEHYPKLSIKLGEEVLRIANLSNDYINDVSFTLNKGEILGIAGLLGSGRTALAKTIIGMEKPKTGQIFIKSREIRIQSPLDSKRNGIGFISENRNTLGLFKLLNVKENITIANLETVSGALFISGNKEKVVANDLIKRLGIKTAGYDQIISNLSGGNKQKVILARSLLSKANIFIFDEPTTGIDVAGKVEIYNLMNELVRKGAAIIIISSDFSELVGMSNRILVISKGSVVKELSREEATQELLFFYACGGRDEASNQ
jgi:ABC-type sugar transport system, ATPase component